MQNKTIRSRECFKTETENQKRPNVFALPESPSRFKKHPIEGGLRHEAVAERYAVKAGLQ